MSYCIIFSRLYHFISVQGAQSASNNRYLKMRIESSGEFLNKFQGATYTFLTRPLNLVFEYDIVDGT